MEINKTSKFIITLSLFLISFTSISQTKYTGYQYVMNGDNYYSFKYTREYKVEDSIYKTIYKIYHPKKGYHFITIIANHYKNEKKVVVEVRDAGGGILSEINTEQTTYENPSMEPFGFRGAAGALGGNRIPNQLMVKFASKKFENVKVVNVNATESGTNNFIYYILDEKI